MAGAPVPDRPMTHGNGSHGLKVPLVTPMCSSERGEVIVQSRSGERPSAPIERPRTLIGEHGNVIAHFNQPQLDQRPDVIGTDRHQLGSLAFDIAQGPSKTDSRVHVQMRHL
jgi:hypothetical protein